MIGRGAGTYEIRRKMRNLPINLQSGHGAAIAYVFLVFSFALDEDEGELYEGRDCF